MLPLRMWLQVRDEVSGQETTQVEEWREGGYERKKRFGSGTGLDSQTTIEKWNGEGLALLLQG